MLCASAWRNCWLLNQPSFSERDVGRAALRARAGVHVEDEERGAEGRAAPVDDEVALLLLERLEARVLPARDAVQIRLARLEQGELGLDVLNEQVHDAVEIGEAVPLGVRHPVVRVAPQHHPLAGDVALDGERPRADHRARVRIDAPDGAERPVLDVRLEDVARVDRRAHRADEGRERRRQHHPDGVVVHRRDGHRVLDPLPVLQEAEDERVAGARRDVLVVDDAVEGELHVVRGERCAVVPGDVAAQVEGPGQPVLRVLPGLGQRRLDLVGQPRRLGQALEEQAEQARGVGVVREREVEGQRLADRRRGDRAARRPDLVLERLGALLERPDDRLGRVGRIALGLVAVAAGGEGERGRSSSSGRSLERVVSWIDIGSLLRRASSETAYRRTMERLGNRLRISLMKSRGAGLG